MALQSVDRKRLAGCGGVRLPEKLESERRAPRTRRPHPPGDPRQGRPDRLGRGARGPLDRPARRPSSASARAACSPTSAPRRSSSSRPSTPPARSSSSEVIGGSRADSGIGRLLGLTDAWLDYMEREVFRGGCFFAAASLEFDSRPGPVRDRIASMMGEWLLALEAAIQDAQDAGELLDATSTASSSRSRSTRSAWAPTGRSSSTATRRRSSGPGMAIASACRALAGVLARRPARHCFRVESRSTRAPRAARCATRSQSSSASWRRCSPRPGPARRSSGRSSSPGGPRVLDVGDLEALRDELAGRVEEIRRALRERADGEQENREPDRGAGGRSRRATSGSGSRTTTSASRAASTGTRRRASGLVGMLMGWWRVKISSGCP